MSSSSDETSQYGEGRGRKRAKKRRRIEARVLNASWTSANTVKLTYDKAVTKGCMNPVHGRKLQSHMALHLVGCPWKHNVRLMTTTPDTEKAKRYQFCHRLCDPCLSKHGPRCFICNPSPAMEPLGHIRPTVLDAILGEDAIISAQDFVQSTKKWRQVLDDSEATFVVLHCAVLGKEADSIRKKFSLPTSTVVHVLWKTKRSTSLARAPELDPDWTVTFKQKMQFQECPLISFSGAALLKNEGHSSLQDLTLHDMLVMYHPDIFGDSFAVNSMKRAMRMMTLLKDEALPPSPSQTAPPPSVCCLRNAIEQSQRKPTSMKDQCWHAVASTIATMFYKQLKVFMGATLCAFLEQRPEPLEENLKIGLEGDKAPFSRIFFAEGGAVRLLKPPPCNAMDLQILCWTAMDAPQGGEFVIPGHLYEFATGQGSCLVIRPKLYSVLTFPVGNQQQHEKVACAFVCPA